MKPQTPKKVESKQVRGHLSREVLAEAGLRVARSEGVQNLTMKRLASELSVTAMAIYRHFEDKSDLINAVLDKFVQENDVCNHDVPTSDWPRWLYKTYSNMYFGLQSMPSVYPYLSTASRFGPDAMAVLEQSLNVMTEAGFSKTRAAEVASVLTGFIIGCGVMDAAVFQSLQVDEENQEKTNMSSLESGLKLIIAGLENENNSKKN